MSAVENSYFDSRASHIQIQQCSEVSFVSQKGFHLYRFSALVCIDMTGVIKINRNTILEVVDDILLTEGAGRP
jgi:hypothetical protein